MSRKPERRGRLRTIWNRVFYAVGVAIIVGTWLYAYRSYFEHYDSLHPEIAWAIPWVQIDTIKAKGVLLWNETKILAPRSGQVRYPHGPGPLIVAKGDVVARVHAGPSAFDVKAPSPGYFVAGVDGAEGAWRYSTIWMSKKGLPTAKPVGIIRDGASVSTGGVVGKIALQPQELRFVGYVDMSPKLKKQLDVNTLKVKLDDLDTASEARVRVYQEEFYKAKVYLSLPWFPPSLITSREYELTVELGEARGMAVPETAVVISGDTLGVYKLDGVTAKFAPVAGQTLDGKRFLVTEGLKTGDAVIVDGVSGREGRVKLW